MAWPHGFVELLVIVFLVEFSCRLFTIELLIGAGDLGLLQWRTLRKLKRPFGCLMAL